jgi:hypothetical protein
MTVDRDGPQPVRQYSWNWGGEEDSRPGLPWIGVFLVVFGLLLLVDRLLPEYQVTDWLLLAVGVVFLARWAVERGTAWLYAGAVVTALAAPDLIEASGLAAGEGLGTVCLGIAFAVIALIRWQTTRGVGWQAWLGAILIVWGASRMALPDLSQVVLPALLVAFGVLLVVRGLPRR